MANSLGELKRVRFVCHYDGQTVSSGWGLWREGEIAEILDVHQKAGRRVEVEESSEGVVPRRLAGPVEFPVWLGTDADFFDEFTVIEGEA